MSDIAVLAAVVLGVILAYFVSPYLYIQWLRYRQAQLVEGHAQIVLTFDDGPGHRLTPAVLDLLDEYHAHATFFILGRSVRQKEHLIQDAVQRGHEIGTHSYDHLHSWRVSPLRAIVDICRGQNEIARVLKKDEVLSFRPPGGKVNLLTLLYLLRRRVPICTWTLDIRDTWPASKREGAQVEARLQAAHGAIILAHDFDRTNPRTERYILETLRATLDYARCHGIQPCTMTEAMRMPRPETSPSVIVSLYECWSRTQERLFERLSASYTARPLQWRLGEHPPERTATGPQPPSDVA